MNMLETYNLQSSAYYSHLTEANYDLAAAAAAAAASNSLAASNQAAALQQASQAAKDQMPNGHMNGMLDHTGQATSVIPKLEFDKGKKRRSSTLILTPNTKTDSVPNFYQPRK